MKQHSEFKLFEEITVPEYSSPSKRVEKIYAMTMKKMQLPSSRRFGGSKLLLIAAIAAAGLLAAAGYFTASDAFRSYLKEKGAAGETAALSSMSPNIIIIAYFYSANIVNIIPVLAIAIASFRI